MNSDDIDNILRSTQPPERPPEYWEEFPRSIRLETERRPAQPVAVRKPAPWPPVGFWGAGLATACIVLGFVLGFWRGHQSQPVDPQFALAEKLYRESEGLFRNQIRAIVFDPGGPRLVLADRPDIPDSTPYYVKVCGPQGCRSFVTFSGQQLQINGQSCEILADGAGNILVVNDSSVWSESDPAGPFRITARPITL